MRIWLVTIGEPLPLHERIKDRLHRTGYFAHILAEHGHDIIWWTSTFDHFRKVHHFPADATVGPVPNLTIKLLHGYGYGSNLSPLRILDHRKLAGKFSKASQELPAPDIIVSAYPTIELSLAAVRYGKKHNVPVVLDMRDMWPDIFVDSMPKLIRPVASLLTKPMFWESRTACRGATAITGITEAFVEWGLNRGKRNRSKMDKAFPMGYTSAAPISERISEAENYWNSQGIGTNGHSLTVCLIGTIGRQLDLSTVIRAARSLKEAGKDISFVICGTGDRLSHFRSMALQDSNVIFTGWIDATQIYALMRRSAVGLDPLPERYDFLATINNKAIEYMSAGLPVISSPDRGALNDLLKKHRCGMSFPHGNSDALANLLARLYDDRSILRRMSENSARLFQTKFQAEKVYVGMMEHLVEIAEMHKRNLGVHPESRKSY